MAGKIEAFGRRSEESTHYPKGSRQNLIRQPTMEGGKVEASAALGLAAFLSRNFPVLTPLPPVAHSTGVRVSPGFSATSAMNRD